MNDRPHDQSNDQSNDDSVLEQRLRRYYGARRASGLTAEELRARVAARLAADLATSPARMALSISKETTLRTRRSEHLVPPDVRRELRPSRRDGRASGIAAVLATVAVVALAAVVFSGIWRAMPARPGTSSHSTGNGIGGANVSMPPLPAGAWTAVYLDADARLHFDTASGMDIVGQALPEAGLITSQPALPLHVASISPDGRRLAYVQSGDPNTGGKVAILDFATGTLLVTNVTALQVFWSPDSTTVAAGGQLGTGTLWLVNARLGAARSVDVQVSGAPGGIGRLLAWSDNAHVAAIVSASAPHADHLSGGPENLLGLIDIASGQAQVITHLVSPPDVYASPDGAAALIAASAWNPTAQLANLRTGAVTPLPTITAAFANKLVNIDNANYAQGGNYSTHFAWRPGTHTLALSLRASGVGPEGTTGPATQPAGVWLLNLDTDTVTQVTHDTYPLAWSADGTMLLLCSLPTAEDFTSGAGMGRNLSVLTPVSAQGKQHRLASDMAAFLGIAA